MGDAQSAQREDKKDAAAEEESGKVHDAQTEQNTQDKPLNNNGQISEINVKADDTEGEINGHCEDEITTEAILSQGEDLTETEKPLKEEETPLKSVEINEQKPSFEDEPLEVIEMNAKQNDINEGFRRFFSNIGLKLTVKRGSSEKATDAPDKTNKEEPNIPEDVNDTKSNNAELNTDVNIAQKSCDNDSTCPTMTDVTSEDVVDNVKEEIPKTKEETESNDAEAATTPAAGVQDAHQDASPEDEPDAISPSSPEEEVIVSPIKKFFTTGIFSGLRKKKKLADDETTGKELVDTGKKEVIDMTEQSVQDQQLDEKESTGIKADEVEAAHKENELKEEILSATSDQISDEGKSSSTDPSTIIASEPHIMSPQEKDKVQASPLKRLLSGSNLKKPLKKPGSRRSSDAKLSDSGEHVSDQLLSSSESAENQKEEGPPQPPKEVAGQSEGAWASFKKLLTPKKRIKQPSLTIEETQIPDRVEESKPSEGEQVSDHSTEEGKKRKDSSVSWEAVLCGSGRRRSRKTSDSEDETPQIDNKEQNQDGGSKHVAESPPESCNENENEIITSSPKQAGSPSEGEGASTWKSLKKLVTPKRRAKDVDESKDNIQSDSEVTQDESSFSIKKLLPGRKKRKSAEKQDQVSSDEAEKDIASDEDSETPAVIPLSEFDKVETEVNIEAQADIKSHIPEEENHELEQDLPYQIAEPVLPCDSLHTEAKNIQDNDALEKQISPTPATNEESDDLTESVSKHQQLSDIPEEGAITETIATPASVTGEAARDDTIAEDLTEITSEAFTAPEPASDILLADETEMISAVSQLSSESSKTSGNTTPVLVENDIIDTDRLLYQVVKTVSDSPQAVPVCSEELSSERIVSSVSHQLLESFVKEEQQMEIHKRMDAAAVNTGLNVDELAAPCQTESISEINDSVSTEVVSELPTEEFDTAEMAPDEIQSNVTHPKESETELEKTKESLPFVECPSEINASLSTDLLTEGEEIVLDEGPLVEAHKAETEAQKMDSKESDLTAVVADETKDGAMEHKVQTQTEKEDQLMYIVTDQIQVEDKDQPSVKVEELQESAAIHATTPDSEEGSVQLLEKEAVSEDIPVAETVTHELKEDILPPTEVNVEPEEENELETGVAKTEPVLVQEVSEAVPAPTLDSEKSSVQSPEEEDKSEDISSAETVTDESKQTKDCLTDVSVESENKELPVDAVKTENVQQLEVIDAIPAPTLDSEESSIQSQEDQVKPKDILPEETVTKESKQTEDNLVDISAEQEDKNLPVNAVKTEHVQELEEIKAVSALTLDSEEGSAQLPEEEVKPKDVSTEKTVTEEPQQTAQHLTEVSFEQEDKNLPVNAVKTEHVQKLEEIKADSVLTLDSEEGSAQLPEEEVKPKDVSTEKTVTEEPQQTAQHLNEVNFEPEDRKLPVDAVKTEAVPAPTLDSEKSSVQSPEEEDKSEDISSAETVTDESKQTKDCLTDVSVESENKELPVDAVKTENVQQLEVIDAIPAPTLNSEESSIQSPEDQVKPKDILPEETVTNESKQTEDNLVDISAEQEDKNLPVNAVKTEHVQELEEIKAVSVLTLDSEEGSAQLPEEEVKPKDVSTEKTVTEEPQQMAQHLNEVNFEPKLPADAVKTEQVQELEEIKADSVLTLDSEDGSAQLQEEEVKPKDVSTEKTVTEEPQQTAQHLNEVNFEPKLPVDAVKTEQVQELEKIKTVPANLDSEESSSQTPEETVEPKDIIPQEPVTDEQKPTDHLTDFSVEEENKELPVNAVKSNNVQELEVTDTVPAPTLDSEEGSIKLPEKEVISQDSPKAERVTDEPKEDTFLITEDNLDSVDAFETEHVQELKELQSAQTATEPEADNFLLHEKKVTSEDITAVVTVTDKPEQENDLRVNMEEKQPLEAAQTEPVQEPEVLSSDVKDIVNETKSKEEASMHEPVVTESIEGVGAQEIDKHMPLEHIPKPDTTSVTASFTDESEVVAQLGKASEITEDQKTESIPQDAQVEQKDYIPEVDDKVQTITAVHVSSVNEKAQNVQVIAKTVFSEETSALDEDNDGVTHELKTEMHLSAVQVLDEPDKEGAATEHAVVAQVVVCNFKDSSDPISDTLTEKTSEITEPLIEKMASEVVLMEESATAAPLVEEDVTETADEGTVDVIMHEPLVAIEDNHRIQEQVVDVDIKSAETIVDSVLEVGITETKEVIDVCQETVEKLDNLSATPETKEELMTKENQVTIQEVTQHVKENLPETVPESVIVNLNQEIHKQPDELTNVGEMVESELNNVENQKTMDDSNGPRKERQDEAPAVMSNDSPSDRQMTEDPMQACDIPGSSDVSSYDHKEDLEETKAEQEKSVEDVPAEEVKSSSNESDQTKIHEQAQDAQIAQSPIGTPSTTGLEVPQNTGVISSVGNVEPPSSLSLEFKLNIQFGQAKAPVPLPLATERTASTKQTEDVSEVKVQAAETIEPIKLINPTQEDEGQKQAELTEAAVQAEITEPAATRAMITAQPVLLDFGIQAETIEPAEQIESTERVTSSVQPSESIHPIRPTEKSEMFLSQPVLLKACVQETKSEEPEQKVEENDQDVWMDAEEVISSQEETEVSIPKVEEPQEPLTESEQQEKAGPGHELMTETAPDSKTEEESQPEMHKTDKTCEIESDSEDFAVALEDLDTATMIVTTMEVE